MRKRKFLWLKALPPSAWEELEVWTSVLLGLAAGALLYATLTAQAARAAELSSDVESAEQLLHWLGAVALIVAGSVLVATYFPRRPS
jgi:purine-cytosine permease-like protein